VLAFWGVLLPGYGELTDGRKCIDISGSRFFSIIEILLKLVGCIGEIGNY